MASVWRDPARLRREKGCFVTGERQLCRVRTAHLFGCLTPHRIGFYDFADTHNPPEFLDIVNGERCAPYKLKMRFSH